jgi:hypothetical protein
MSPARVSLTEGWVRRVRREKVVVWSVVGRGWDELPVRFGEGLGTWVSEWLGEGRDWRGLTCG